MSVFMNQRFWRIISLFLFLLGIGFLIYAALTGNIDAGLFLIFPVVFGTGWIAALGVLFIVIAMLLFMFGLMFSTPGFSSDTERLTWSKSNNNLEGGGIVFLGPIPVMVGSNWKIARVLLIIAVIIITVSLVVLPALL